ncbi:MAG: hypothetical protein N3G20_06745, partial [Verrucomicrobiae bacterium]|nr:hypothetical protein [Verrucomicrobiae bacterium]
MFQRVGMTTPLALIFYENILIGNQLANRLRDLGYRVCTIAAHELSQLTSIAQQEKPLIVIVQLANQAEQVCAS